MTDWEQYGEDLLRRGTLAWERRDRSTAEKLFTQLVQQFPERPEGYNKLGVLCADSGQLEAAEQYFLRALAADGRHAPALTNLGNIYLERGDVDQAIQHYLLALNHDPDYPPAHRNLSVAYKRQGKYSAFVSHFKRSQRLDARRAQEDIRARARVKDGDGRSMMAWVPPWLWWVAVAAGLLIILTVFHP
ncbi:MAG: tetratricopeptide repeat protein [Firmicutes bacterium]|nr:tetratricopeptide repeat protein [Bacillota bacterium]